MGSREQIANFDGVCNCYMRGQLWSSQRSRSASSCVCRHGGASYRAGVSELSVPGVAQPVPEDREQLQTALPFGGDQKLHSELSKAGLWVRQPSKSNIG